MDLTALAQSNSDLAQQLHRDITSDHPSVACLTAPRRRHGDGEAAAAIAEAMYPGKTPLAAVIQYERDIVELRSKVLSRQSAQRMAIHDAKGRTHRGAVRKQGPWDPSRNFFEGKDDDADFRGGKRGVTAIPMPVEVATIETLVPFFEFLKSNQSPFAPEVHLSAPMKTKSDREPYYGVEMIEFNKGVLYTDARMDLCKMVVGPNHIKTLMSSLEENQHVKHFLLGNNIIGPTGARAIADFLQKYPNRMETWYLAGNMIGVSDFAVLADAMVGSEVQSLWLKRNPLTAASVKDLAKVILGCPRLRVLDLDQCEIGDDGVTELFHILRGKKNALETIYLNGNGVSRKACLAIGIFLCAPYGNLKNLYLSGNPIGDYGADALSTCFPWSRFLERVSLTSCGINSEGAIKIAKALTGHPTIISLDLGQSIATEDLGFKYNWIEDKAMDSFGNLVTKTKKFRYLNLGTTAITSEGINTIRNYVRCSRSLFSFTAKSCYVRSPDSQAVRAQLEQNVQRKLNITMAEFTAGPLRFLRSPEDVRHIDSVYRNRDAQAARRSEKILKKDWDSDDDTMEEVLRYGDDDSKLS